MATLMTLIRHGHTAWNGLGRYQGHAPVPLSERGLAQATVLAEALAAEEGIGAIFSSDLARCRQTAAPLSAALGLPVQLDPRLREFNYGCWQGLTRAEAAAWDSEAFAAYSAAPETIRVPGGECQAELAARVRAALTDILGAHAERQVLVVTHGGPIRAILRHYGLWSGQRPSGNASCTVVEVSRDGTARLVVDGDVSYLPADLRPESSGTTFMA
jgi:broad specificity phosphatase PhoE